MSRVALTSARFVITGEFITQQARTFWQEGQFEGAVDLLKCCDGMNMEQCMGIIMGTHKLTGQNDSILLVEDTWEKPDEYPSLSDVLRAAGEGPELQERRRKEAFEIAAQFAKLERDTTAGWCTGEDAETMKGMRPAILRLLKSEDETDRMIDEARQSIQSRVEEKRPAALDTPRLDPLVEVAAMARTNMMMAGMDPDSVPSIDALLNRGSTIKPTLCSDMSAPSGWLLPDGKYYPCGAMEHVGLAETLLKDDVSKEANSERLAEKRGWIKISKAPILGFHCTAFKKATAKQLTKLWDYCQKHKQDYETVLKKLPN